MIFTTCIYLLGAASVLPFTVTYWHTYKMADRSRNKFAEIAQCVVDALYEQTTADLGELEAKIDQIIAKYDGHQNHNRQSLTMRSK